MIRMFSRGAALAILTLALCGCGSYPLPTLYVLGERAAPTPGVVSRTGLPVIELKTVTVPDDLDSTDIIRREGANRAIASPTGQWKDRLSVAVTSALAADLRRRLPDVVVETAGDSAPARRLVVDVESFEIGSDGVCSLTARWSLAGPDAKAAPISEKGAFVETSSGTDDAVAAAMTSAIDELAARIAATIRKGSPANAAP